MARPKKTIRSRSIHVSLPEDLAAKVTAHLFSELEGCVPFGAQAEFFTKLVREFFAKEDAQ